MDDLQWISIVDGAEEQSAWQDIQDLNALAKLLNEAGEPLLGEYYAATAIQIWLGAGLSHAHML